MAGTHQHPLTGALTPLDPTDHRRTSLPGGDALDGVVAMCLRIGQEHDVAAIRGEAIAGPRVRGSVRSCVPVVRSQSRRLLSDAAGSLALRPARRRRLPGAELGVVETAQLATGGNVPGVHAGVEAGGEEPRPVEKRT